MEKLFCNSENCPNPPRVKGLCPTHYEQQAHGYRPKSINLSPHPVCAVSHCDIEATSRKEGSLCQPHYQKKYRGIDPETYIVPEDNAFKNKPKCVEPGCERMSRSNGVCDYHRTRARIGKTQAEVVIKRTPPCKFEGCIHVSSQGGWCQTHYEQLRLTGEVKKARTYGKYTKRELKCPVPGCRKPQVARSLCTSHLTMIKKYRVTREELIEIWREPVCSNPSCGITSRLHMDHDHVTGEFRGLLCRGCNHALGNLAESPERMTGLREYIERFQ